MAHIPNHKNVESCLTFHHSSPPHHQTVPEGEQAAADVTVSDGEIVAPAAALAATDALHAGLHKYSAALATALGSDADAGAALAAFLAAFPPPARPPAGGAKSASSSPSVSPIITERAEPSPIKKKGGLGFAGAAGTAQAATRFSLEQESCAFFWHYIYWH
jgi:hypothetical protein